MTPASRLATAIELLDQIIDGAPAEVVLTNWARRARYAGSKDRNAVRDIVYECLRKKRSYAWMAGDDESGRGLVLSFVRDNGDDPAKFFTGTGYAPDALTPEEIAADYDLSDAPNPVRFDYPDFLDEDFSRALGDNLTVVMEAMRSRAPVFVRVNLTRTTVEAARQALAVDGIDAAFVPDRPAALQVESNARQLSGAGAYRDGLVEIQDASSQAVAAFADVGPGQKVLDYCAGGGGKALALWDNARGKAHIFAHDIATVRMNDLPARAARAGARIGIVQPGDALLVPGSFDLVFVDAPCSGTGAWRRTPDAKWRFTPEQLDHLCTVQRDILQRASALVKPGGQLVYATCSLLERENDAQADDFLASGQPFTDQGRLHLTPANGGDGFFAAKLSRQ